MFNMRDLRGELVIRLAGARVKHLNSFLSLTIRGKDPKLFSSDPDPAQLEKKNSDPDQTLNRNGKEIYIYIG